jgi:hypothetical protein
VGSEPSIQCGRRAIRQKIDDSVALQITDQRAAALPALPRPIVNADDGWCATPPISTTAKGAEQRVAAHWQQQSGCEAGAGAAAEGQAEMMRQPIEPGRPASKRCCNRGTEAFGEDPRRAGSHGAAEAADRYADLEHPARIRQIHECPAIAAVDSSRSAAAARTSRIACG